MNAVADSPPLLDLTSVRAAIAGGELPQTAYRQALKRASATILNRFQPQLPVAPLVRARTRLVEQVLEAVWEDLERPFPDAIAMVAVGGFGRGELHPYSDIDLLLLLESQETPQVEEWLRQFVTFLWDIGLEVGHSVRTVQECVTEAIEDITIATNLMEARLLAGSRSLFNDMVHGTGPEFVWPGNSFFEAKCLEQKARYRKYDDTAYKLEPNLKEGPGGLRDIQTFGWVVKRHYGCQTLHGLVEVGFLTEDEYQTLEASQEFLWKVRFVLHRLNSRREDRLLFDYQRAAAEQMGYRDQDFQMGVERFMQAYYRTILQVSRLNEMLLQLFIERIGQRAPVSEPVEINRRFKSVNSYLEVTDPRVFARSPLALLEVFLLMQQHPELQGVGAGTIRLIRDNVHRIDQNFRNDLGARTLFMEILRQPRGITHELRRMNRYGILAAYLPAFGNIVGRMQYDLFHVYTVDEHTLFVVRNLRRMMVDEHRDELPLCSEIAEKIPKRELLYLAGLFHDIAKGRGGDHSELGARDAEEFCIQHGLSPWDTRLVSWLVRNHLTMSVTAQRKDIGDPQVIHEFAAQVDNPIRLDYLYMLTCADIRGTSPKLWNSFRDSLLKELYFATRKALRRGLRNPLAAEEHKAGIQGEARELLHKAGFDDRQIDTVWKNMGDDYFLRYSPDEIGWHTQSLVGTDDADLPLVLVRRETQRGGSEVFVYAADQVHLFAKVASILDRLGLNVLDARISTSLDGHNLESFLVLEDAGVIIDANYRAMEIVDELRRVLRDPNSEPVNVSRRQPRQHKHFPISTRIDFYPDESHNRTVLELITADRPGLLSSVAQVFSGCAVAVSDAKIATFGTRAEDIFYLTDISGNPLSTEQQMRCLREGLLEALNSRH